VGRAPLWIFHNARTGLCIPSYKAIAKAAGCTEDTVGRAIQMLEAARILTWCRRLAWVTVRGVRKVIRTSNSYRFQDPGSNTELPSGTKNQSHLSILQAPRTTPKGSVLPPGGIPDGVYACKGVK
jgi:hypothetical protein